MKQFNRYIRIILLVLAATVAGAAGIRLISENHERISESDYSYMREPLHENGSRVLFISSYEPTYIIVPGETEGITSVLYEHGYNVDVEYMKNHEDNSKEAEENFEKIIEKRMTRQEYRGIILGDDAALLFGMKHRDDLFRDLPITFLGVSSFHNAEVAAEYSNMSGFYENVNLPATVQAAVNILPDADKIVGIVDNTVTGLDYQSVFDSLESQFPRYVFYKINASVMTRKELGEQVAEVGQDSILIYMNAATDVSGQKYTFADTALYLSSMAKVPVFRSNIGGYGNGVLGGQIMDFSQAGRSAAGLLLRAMDGEDISDVPVSTDTEAVFLFDVNVMRRFGIRSSSLPENARLLNYSPTFWEENSWLIVPGVLLIAVLSILLFAALHSYRSQLEAAGKLRETEKDLIKVNEHLSYISGHDELTGLKNRYQLEQNDQIFLGRELLVSFCDIDNFKYYNDMYDHDVGDAILKAFAQILKVTYDESEIYRYGGDEFLIIDTAANEAELKENWGIVCRALESLDIGKRRLHVTFSMGYVRGTVKTREDLRDMIHIADLRNYEAKEEDSGKLVGGGFDKDMLRVGNIENRIGLRGNVRLKDPLTGAGSMGYFMTRGDEILHMSSKIRKPSVLYFNFMNFSLYNNAYGFEEGDRLLKNTAKILQEEFAERLVARFAEDHFVVMAYQKDYEEKLDRVFDRIKACQKDNSLRLICGICQAREGWSVGTLCDRAKIVADSLKIQGGTVGWYNDTYEKAITQRQYVLSRLDEAIRQGHIRPYYQEIYRPKSRRFCGSEALARWVDPGRGVISPGEFVPILEEAHRIHKVDFAILKAVLRDFEVKKKAGMPLLPVSVNLSRLDFDVIDVVEEVTRLVDEGGWPHSLIRIEITESAAAEDMDALRKEVGRFHEHGFEVWMDDFGSGYSSLNILQEINVDELKLDAHFMKHFEKGGRNALIVRSIIRMASELRIHTLAEGVETRVQEELLESMGIGKIQGFYFSRPEPLETILKRAKEQKEERYEDPNQQDSFDRAD